MASMHISSASPRRQQNKFAVNSDELLLLKKREEQLEGTFQELLDAQAEGLMAGLSVDPQHDHSTTSQDLPRVSLSPAAHSRGKRVNLGTARLGLWQTLRDCATLKEEEDAIIRKQMEQNYAVKENIFDWDLRGRRLRKKIDSIEGQDTAARTAALKEEADNLQQEITETEQKLSHMKSRHKALLDELLEVENSVQSALSSYKSSLAMLEKDIQVFLTHPPIETSVFSNRDDSSFLVLPPNRRTLEMAKDYWDGEKKVLERKLKSNRKDLMSLKEGAEVWKSTVSDITAFERFLQKGIQRGEGEGGGDNPGVVEPVEIFPRMDATIQSIESKLQLAVSKKWKLLEVAIGAELEAFRQVKDMLEETFSEAPSSDHGIENWTDASQNGVTSLRQQQHHSEEHLAEQLNAQSAGLHQRLLYTDEDEDEPSADLMVSKRDYDDDTD